MDTLQMQNVANFHNETIQLNSCTAQSLYEMADSDIQQIMESFKSMMHKVKLALSDQAETDTSPTVMNMRRGLCVTQTKFRNVCIEAYHRGLIDRSQLPASK